MVEELKLAIKIDDATIEQSLLKQFANAQKMADKVVLDFKNVNFDDKQIEAKFKEMQKKAGQNPIDLTIGGNTLDMLGQIDKRLAEIFSIGKGKSFIDSSSITADIGKIENKINELNKKYEESQKKLSSIGSGGISGKDVNLVDNKEFQKLSDNFEKIKGEIDELKQKINTINIDTEWLNNFTTGLDEELTDTQAKLDNFINDFNSSFEKINTSTSNTFFNEESIRIFEKLLTSIESSLSSIKGALVDIGDGEELSPLLKNINNIEVAVNRLSSSVKGIGLNMNIDLGSDKEMEAKAESKISNALQAYQRLFEHIKMSSTGGSIINTKFFDFDINQYDTAMSKLQAYKKFIENMRNEAKAMYGGQDVLFTDTDKKYWTQASSAMGQVTKTFNEMKAASDTNPLENIFGKTDLSGVIEQLNTIVSKLDEISVSAKGFVETFKNGLNVNASVEEIEKLTNRVKELEDELAEVKVPTALPSEESNISSGSNPTPEVSQNNNISDSIQKKKEALASYELQLEETRYEVEKLSNAESKLPYGFNRTYNDEKTASMRDRATDIVLGNNSSSSERSGSKKWYALGNLANIDASALKIYQMWQEELQKVGYTLSEIRDTSVGLTADIIPIDGKAITNAEEFRKTLDSITTLPSKNVQLLNQQITELESKISSLKSEIASLGSHSTDQRKDAFHSDIDTSSSVKSLENLEEEIKKIFTDANELQDILDSLHNGKYFHLSWTTDGIDETGADGRVRQLSKLLKEYGYTINNFKSDSDAFDTSGVINTIKEENNVLEQNTQKVKENTQAKEQNVNVNLNKYDKRLDSYNGKIDKYKTTINRFNDGGWTSSTYLENVQAVKNAVKEYETLLNELKGKDASLVTSDDISKLDEYEKKIKDTIATVTNMSASEKGYNFVSAQKELDKIHKLLNENSNMSAEAKAKIKSYYAEIESGNPSMSLDRIHGEIMKIYNAEVEAGRAGKSFFDTLKNSGFHQIAAQMAGMFGVYDVINVIKQAASTVTELNTQVTELAKVSEQSSKQIYADFDSYADIAKEVRGTISDTIAATADWSKNGYSIPDAKQLAEISQLYKNVGDGIDIDAANESLISTLKGFQLEADQAEHIVDVFNEVSNNESISSGGIGEALQRSAASFNAASTSLEKSVSLVTATNSVLQDPEKVGNMWRTVSARLRGSEIELKEMGEDTDGLVTSTSKLQALVKGITGFDIMKDKDTYKDIYDIVLGIGEKWQDLSDIDRASLLEALAGKQQSNALAAALSNIDILKKSYEEATNAEGSARKENEEYSKSIQASIDLAQAKLEQLANDTLNSNFLKGAIDAGGKLIEVLNGIVKSGNAIPTLLAAIGAGLSFKNVGEWNYISKFHSNNIICFIV